MAAVSIRVLLGVFFLGFSCVAFFSMLHLLGAPHTPYAKTLRVVHRLSGAAAVILYVIIWVMCMASLLRQAGQLSPREAIHLTFGGLFIPFILLKILIVEKYPELRNRLFAIGTVLFTIVFVIFFTSSFLYLVRGPQEARAPGPDLEPNLSLARELLVTKCSKCHRLERALSARKTPQEWEATVNTMRQKDRTWISETEAEGITRFLMSLGGPAQHD